MSVFEIVELWDMILPLVDGFDIFRLQQVCRLFNDRIKGDIICQRRLFLSAGGLVVDNDIERSTKLDTDPKTIRFNPFLTRISIPPFIDWSNYLLRNKDANPQPQVPKIQMWDLTNYYICLYPLTDSRDESQWKEMFVTQPPITSIAMMLPEGSSYKDHNITYPQDFTVSNPDGLKIRDIVREWKRVTEGNDHLSGAPFCLVVYGFARYERFYSAYRRVLLEYQNTCGKCLAECGYRRRY